MQAWKRIATVGAAAGLALVVMGGTAQATETISANFKAHGDGHVTYNDGGCIVHEVHTGVLRRDTNDSDNNRVFGSYRIDACGSLIRSAPDGTPEVDTYVTFRITSPLGRVWGSGYGAVRTDASTPNVEHYIDTVRVAGGTRGFSAVRATLAVQGTEVFHGTNFTDNFRLIMTLGA